MCFEFVGVCILIDVSLDYVKRSSRVNADTHTNKNTSKSKVGLLMKKMNTTIMIRISKTNNAQFLLALVCTIVYDFKIQ